MVTLRVRLVVFPASNPTHVACHELSLLATLQFYSRGRVDLEIASIVESTALAVQGQGGSRERRY